MARPLRFQYPGAVYHVMARGDGGKAVFESDDDRKAFLSRLGEVCTSHGWRVHAWVLMGNHFHLLLETPQPNLVSGMKYLLGTFSQGWNRARKRRGHVFQGRYKAVPVSGGQADEWYFRIAADYIHLNPARARLAGGKKGPLLDYQWSSLPAYTKGRWPEWLVFERVLRAFELAQDGRGRRAYIDWLEARAADHAGTIGEAAMRALRRGWYLGDERFKDRLLELVEKPPRSKRAGAGSRDHGEAEAIRMIRQGLATLGLPLDQAGLGRLAKGDPRKVLLASVLRSATTVSNGWIATLLCMGHPGSVSRLISASRGDRALARQRDELEKKLRGEAGG